ncbi:hypothetical protein CAPTEDRAFT_205524 [Capitella teleta]|uniref:Uncharacterized protein n=1 Tax=Capitella teleta TaxID=283909 RepID=R7TVK2_CAPTE|nr:hypothetical protein CAPTEDRAFT_205524 [Capitella teleta]|eukprot:ELT97908.1 hypothetical protein CAPTEDRAFT_205524 [Capitella teleta]
MADGHRHYHHSCLMNVNYVLEDICEKYIKKEHSKIRDALRKNINQPSKNQLRNLWQRSVEDAINAPTSYLEMSLQNCDFEKIQTDPWQLAKACMMSGSQKCTSAQETDVSGLLAVFLNAKVFDIFGSEVMKAAKCMTQQIEEMPTVDESIATPNPESDLRPPSPSVQIDSGEQQLINEK